MSARLGAPPCVSAGRPLAKCGLDGRARQDTLQVLGSFDLRGAV